MEFKDVLRELRIERGLTQEQLAKEVGYSWSIINKWECGKKKPGHDAIITLAKYFDVPAGYLLGIED